MKELVDRLARATWDYQLERSEYLRLRVGLPVTRLHAHGAAEAAEAATFARETIRQLDAADQPLLDDERRLTAEFLRHQAEAAIEAERFHWFPFRITPYLAGMLSRPLQMVFAPLESGELYMSLVEDYAALVEGALEHTREQARRGIRLARPALPNSIATITAIRDLAVRSLKAEKLVESRVRPAFDALLDFLGPEYAEHAPAEVGIGRCEGGEEYYAAAVRRETTLDLAPEEVHRTGLEQVALLTDEMAEVRGRLGFTGTESEFHAQLRHEPRLYVKTPDEVAARLTGYMERLAPLLPRYFSVLPKAPYGVERLEPELEAGMTYGYYDPPTPVKPSGRYRFNGSQLESRSLLNAAALIYHELAPGHHFHIARQAENEALPEVRRYAMHLTSFNEGWAEYASGLAREMGLLDDPLDLYGRLVHERFTAVRLVLDPALNLLGWPLEKAREYMSANTFESELQVASETLRYSTDLPAQALAYRSGNLEIRRLREREQAAQGGAFDVRAFHEAVLGPGALPLTVLGRHLESRLPAAQR